MARSRPAAASRYRGAVTNETTPDPIRNDALDELKKDLAEKGVEGLIVPDEVVLQHLSDPQPTDAIGSEDWDDPKE